MYIHVYISIYIHMIYMLLGEDDRRINLQDIAGELAGGAIRLQCMYGNAQSDDSLIIHSKIKMCTYTQA